MTDYMERKRLMFRKSAERARKKRQAERDGYFVVRYEKPVRQTEGEKDMCLLRV